MTTCACENCQFMLSNSKPAGKHKAEDLGECRYNPPAPQPAENLRGLWPRVAPRDWCGHFAARVERFMSAAE
jgi:hypothetical protein